MKKFHKKSLVLLASVALLLTFAVSGTVAYLADATGAVVNEFKPAKVDITVTDEIDAGAKKNVVIGNSSTIPVYIRVAVVANWYKDGEIVAPWNEATYGALPVTADWIKGSDGYYYYTKAVQPSEKSVNFFEADNSYTPSPAVADAHLEMTIIAQAIQTEPADALTAAHWAWSPVSTTN